MKNIILTLIALSTGFFSEAQIQVIEGTTYTDSVIIRKNEFIPDMKLGYVANSVRIQEFKEYKLTDVLVVTQVIFFKDKIYYAVMNKNGYVFGITFTFSDRTIFFADVNGNFIEFSGDGLTFAHQY